MVTGTRLALDDRHFDKESAVKPLSKQIKQAIEALAFADLGERSGRVAMEEALGASPLAAAAPERSKPAQRMIALGVGQYLPPAVMSYALGACRRMNAGLLLVSADATAAGYLISPYLGELADVRCETAQLSAPTRGAVLQLLSRRSDVLFAVTGTPDDPVAALADGRRGLLSGKSPVPVVIVGNEPKSTTTQPAPALAAAH